MAQNGRPARLPRSLPHASHARAHPRHGGARPQQGNVAGPQPAAVDEATARSAAVRIEAHSSAGELAQGCTCDEAVDGGGLGVRSDEIVENGTVSSWYGCAKPTGVGGASLFDPNQRCATVAQASVVLEEAAWLALKSAVLAANPAALVGNYSCDLAEHACASDPLFVALTLEVDGVKSTVTLPNAEPQVLPVGLQRIVAALVAVGFRL